MQLFLCWWSFLPTTRDWVRNVLWSKFVPYINIMFYYRLGFTLSIVSSCTEPFIAVVSLKLFFVLCMYYEIVQLSVQYVQHHVCGFFLRCVEYKKNSVMCDTVLLVHIAPTINCQGTLMSFPFDWLITFVSLVVHAFCPIYDQVHKCLKLFD